MERKSPWQRCFITIIGIITIGVIVIVFIFAGYGFRWSWTGFTASIGPAVQNYQPTKTLWDWMQLLIIPAVLAGGGFLFNAAMSRNDQRIV
jgi:hypothetical protein